MGYEQEQALAEWAVQKAVIVTRKVLQQVEKDELGKKDKTSVSLADFAAQAILVAAIHHRFPQDTIVGEEDTALLRERPDLAAKIWDLVSTTHLDIHENPVEPLHTPGSLEDTLRYIDLGGISYGGPHGRVWMIDPIDGTKGYLNQGQYVVCVVLLVDGVEQVAAFGCPHVDSNAGKVSESDACLEGPGCLISASKGKGAVIRPLSQNALLPARSLGMRDEVWDLKGLRFCENTKTTSPQFKDPQKIAAGLGAPWDPIHIYSTQLRYLSLALGLSDVVLRIPLPGDAPAHVWDHAGGILVFEETGGKVTDLNGKLLDLTTGRDLTSNFGLIAAPANIHAEVQRAVYAVLSQYPEYNDIITSTSE